MRRRCRQTGSCGAAPFSKGGISPVVAIASTPQRRQPPIANGLIAGSGSYPADKNPYYDLEKIREMGYFKNGDLICQLGGMECER
jgi:hypothetical protein